MSTTVDLPGELLLPNRSGLPAAVAWLRDDHPAADWPAHANYGQLAAFWLQVHADLRRQGAQVDAAIRSFGEGRVDAAAFGRRFASQLQHFLGHLDAHHRIEDHAYFPKFRALDPRMERGFDLLKSDHALIHGALLASAASARTLLGVLPAILRYGERAVS